MICSETCISPQLCEESTSFCVTLFGPENLQSFSTKNAVRFLNLDFIFLLTLTIDDLVIEILWRFYSITEMK